ncbi:hypothetical protein ACOMHN_000808 [Nucella lapillus]
MVRLQDKATVTLVRPMMGAEPLGPCCQGLIAPNALAKSVPTLPLPILPPGCPSPRVRQRLFSALHLNSGEPPIHHRGYTAYMNEIDHHASEMTPPPPFLAVQA